jgi:hypothetical protein
MSRRSVAATSGRLSTVVTATSGAKALAELTCELEPALGNVDQHDAARALQGRARRARPEERQHQGGRRAARAEDHEVATGFPVGPAEHLGETGADRVGLDDRPDQARFAGTHDADLATEASHRLDLDEEIGRALEERRLVPGHQRATELPIAREVVHERPVAVGGSPDRDVDEVQVAAQPNDLQPARECPAGDGSARRHADERVPLGRRRSTHTWS